jgi:hypothetical protein
VLKQVQGTQFFFDRMWNGRVPKLSFPHLYSFTTMEKITLSLVMQQDRLYDLFQLPRKHLRNIVFLKYCYNHCRLITIVTSGNTYGGMVISQLRRHTIISLVPPTLTQHFGGFGVPPASLNTKYFIGYCSETG